MAGGGLRDILMAPGGPRPGAAVAAEVETSPAGRPSRQVLTDLGMPTAFDANAADFSAMTADGGTDLHVDDVVHQTFIAVDEARHRGGCRHRGADGGNHLDARDRRLSSSTGRSCSSSTTPSTWTPLFLGRVVDPRG